VRALVSEGGREGGLESLAVSCQGSAARQPAELQCDGQGGVFRWQDEGRRGLSERLGG
jgi:hypothetical protein